MRKLLILSLLVLAFAIQSSIAQSRVDRVLPLFESKTGKLISATGWELNKETGKWMENPNVIHDNPCPPYLVSRKRQNFKWIQFASVYVDEQQYVVLLYEKQYGQFRYPEIAEDWMEDTRTSFLVMKPWDYDKIVRLMNAENGGDVNISSKMSGYMTDYFQKLGGEHLYNEENLMAKISNSISSPSRGYSCFILNSQVVDGKAVVRFLLPEICELVEDEMETKYFEVAKEDFRKILKGIEIKYEKDSVDRRKPAPPLIKKGGGGIAPPKGHGGGK